MRGKLGSWHRQSGLGGIRWVFPMGIEGFFPLIGRWNGEYCITRSVDRSPRVPVGGLRQGTHSKAKGGHPMRNRSSFHPFAPPAPILPARWMALPLCTLAAAVIIAGALTAVVPAVGEEASSLSAQQCFTCENGECKKNGPGGTTCNEGYVGDEVSCTPGGLRCMCHKVRRWWWLPDTQICVPIQDDSGTAMNGTDDMRYVTFAEADVALHRVGPQHFAATSCQDADTWVVLGHESAAGEIEVITNPVLISLHRWFFELEKQRTVATTQE